MRVALSRTPISDSETKPAPRHAGWKRQRLSRRVAARPRLPDRRELWQQQHQHCRHRQADKADALAGGTPLPYRNEPGGRCRKQHFPDIAGEIIGAEGGAQAPPGEGARRQRRTQRMLHAGAEAAQHQAAEQRDIAAAPSGQQKSKGGNRGAEDEQPAFAELFGEQPGRDLQRRHRTGIDRSQQPDLRQGEAEFRLPDRQEHIEKIAIAIMQRMRAAAGSQHAPAARRLLFGSSPRSAPRKARPLPRSASRRRLLDEFGHHALV